MNTRLLRDARIGLLVGLAYFVTGRVGLSLPAVGSAITLIWIPTGIAAASLLRWGYGCWPGVALGSLAVNLATGVPWPVALAIMAGSTLAALLTAWVLPRLGFHPAFGRQRDILLLAAAAALGMLVSASVGVTALARGGLLPAGRLVAWLVWWVGDAMGVIAAAPLVLTFTRQELRSLLSRRGEFLIWAAVTVFLIWAVFVWNGTSGGQPWAVAFLPLPLAAWAALRFGATGTSLALIVMSIGAAYGTAIDRGPFYRPNPLEELLLLWGFMATNAALGWLITALHVARLKATGIQRLLEQALGDVSLGVLLAGLDRRITYANSGFTRLTGYTEAELLGRSCSILQGSETDPTVVAELKAALHGQGHFDGVILNYRKDGTSFWNALLISPVHNASGEATGFLGIQRDVSNSMIAELALQQSELRHETLLRNLPGMAYRCRNDPSWTMTHVSDGCEALTGYRRDELEDNRSMSYGDLVHPDDRDWLWAKCQASLDAHAPCQNEYRIIDKHGRERWVSERASGVYGGDGRLLFIDGFIQDITASRLAKLEHEELERNMLETQKLESLGVLAGGIAHDFNNILTGILGNASLGLMSLPPGAPAKEYLEAITQASLRAADLCKQMLAYSGKGRFVVQKLDLGQLVETTTQMLQLSISKKAVLRFQLARQLPAIEADATQIRQVIMNLVINASEAIGEDSGVIGISTGVTRVDRAYLAGMASPSEIPEGDFVYLEVSDTGCGMTPETQARIFEPFFTTKFTGRGLGLAAVLGIMRGHRGALKVYSEFGHGTTFKVLFPAVSGPLDPVPETPGSTTGRVGQGTVLVVDDEATIRTTVVRMLSHFGFEAVSASDGREALQVFRANPGRFDVVLLDLTMPYLDGEQTFAELRRLRPDMRVVLMSGFSQQEALLRFTGKGLANFLQKPFGFEALREVLQTASP